MNAMTMHPRILLKVTRGHRFFPLEDIIAVEARDRYAEVILANGEQYPVFHNLTELAGRLKCGQAIGPLVFWRIHRSHIVALHHATQLSRKRVLTLQNGHEFTLNRTEFQQVITACGSIH